MYDFVTNEQICKIKIIGVGGAGNNALNCMYVENLIGCDFYALNTDAQALSYCKVDNEHKVVIGKDFTKGLGAGANPNIGQQAAEASEDEIREICKDANMIFIAAGMGGGTGTGAAPVVARIAKECGALVVGIVTRPFTFEGKTRTQNALAGIERLKEHVDTLITVSNDKVLQLIGNLPLKDSFKEADNVLRKSVQSITDLIAMPALINLDFNDVKTILSKKGPAMIGFGVGKGPHRASEAAANAITSPLLEYTINGAKSAIVSISGGQKSTLYDFHDVVDFIKNATGNDINIIFGANINDELDDELQVTVIATDFNEDVINNQDITFDPKFERKPVGEEVKNEEKNEDDEDDSENDIIPSFFSKRK